MRVLLLILFASNITIAQQQATQNFIATGTASFAWNTNSLQSVTDIATCSTALSNVLIIRDSIRGGLFIKYSGSDAADNGMVFTDALNNKWKRQTSSNILNAQWYGAKSDNEATDNLPIFTAIKAYSKKHPQYRVIYFPYDSTLEPVYNRYYFSDSILIDWDVTITGDGTYKNPKTRFYFPQNKPGIVVKYLNGSSGINVNIRNLRIAGANGANNNTKHGITIGATTNLYNITIDQYDGNGIHISACATPPSGDNNNYGNAAFSNIEAVTVHYATNGMFIEGCDASTIRINECDFSQNERWGVFDNGFLGNAYHQPHFAFNGVQAVGGSSVVSYGGKWYVALPGHDGYYGDATDSNYNKQPDISPTYWMEVTQMTSVVWNSSTRYYSGGPICVKNPNAKAEIFSPYTEEFQPPIWLNYRAIVYNGNNGALVKGYGAWRNMYAGMDMLNNAKLYVEKDAEIIGTVTAGNFIGNGAGITGITASATFAGLTGQPTDNANLSAALAGKQAAGTYATGTGSAMGVNTGDNATNTQYSGLAASKQDVLVSGTNIKTVNGTTLLGSGDLVVSGAGAFRVWLPGDVVNNNAVANTIADVTGLSFPVVAGSKYSFKFFIVYSSAATTTGSRWSINGPATTFVNYRSQYPTSATAITNNAALAGYNLPAASNASSLTANNIAIIEGIIQPSANGTVIARFASEITASAITAIGSRSYVEYSVIN